MGLITLMTLHSCTSDLHAMFALQAPTTCWIEVSMSSRICMYGAGHLVGNKIVHIHDQERNSKVVKSLTTFLQVLPMTLRHGD